MRTTSWTFKPHKLFDLVWNVSLVQIGDKFPHRISLAHSQFLRTSAGVVKQQWLSMQLYLPQVWNTRQTFHLIRRTSLTFDSDISPPRGNCSVSLHKRWWRVPFHANPTGKQTFAFEIVWHPLGATWEKKVAKDKLFCFLFESQTGWKGGLYWPQPNQNKAAGNQTCVGNNEHPFVVDSIRQLQNAIWSEASQISVSPTVLPPKLRDFAQASPLAAHSVPLSIHDCRIQGERNHTSAWVAASEDQISN